MSGGGADAGEQGAPFEKARVRAGSAAAAAVGGRLRAAAARAGFAGCAIASPDAAPDVRALRAWLEAGNAAGMAWLARDPEGRCDPRRFFPEARCVVTVALNYFQPVRADAPLRIARYAWGRDYHGTILARLGRLLELVERWVPGTRGRASVDSSPVLERHWAAVSGLGWIGRHGCLIVPHLGSWVLLGELFLDLPLPAGEAVVSRCGTCRRCLDACPGGALLDGGLVDARRCIAYWTIEHRGRFPESGRPRLDPWLFGCDACQEACPWNRFARPTADPELRTILPAECFDPSAWTAADPRRIGARLGGTPLARVGFEGLLRNAEAIRTEREATAGRSPNSAGE